MFDSNPEKDEMISIQSGSVSDRMEDQKIERKMMITRYKECMKNHAASVGGHATDGCGEFMPSEGSSLDSYKCSVCGCHRNFHRKEIQCSECTHPPFIQHNCHHMQFSSALFSRSNHLIGLSPNSQFHNNNSNILMYPNKSGSSDYGEGDYGNQDDQEKEVAPKQKKRFRTKFTKEQKEKLLSFAEKAEWRMQKLDTTVVQQFCQEIGIKRRILKVWMHNNKHNFTKKLDDAK